MQEEFLSLICCTRRLTYYFWIRYFALINNMNQASRLIDLWREEMLQFNPFDIHN